MALSSRLISKGNVETASRREELVSALLAANTATPGLIILITAPSSFPSSGKTSVTEAWRSSLYHVTVISPWNWNATTEEKRQNYKRASDSIDNLRRITPDAAYLVGLCYLLEFRADDEFTSRMKLTFTSPIMKVRELDRVFFGTGISILVFTFSRLLGRTLSEAAALERKIVRDLANDHCMTLMLIDYSDPNHLLDCWHCGKPVVSSSFSNFLKFSS